MAKKAAVAPVAPKAKGISSEMQAIEFLRTRSLANVVQADKTDGLA